MAIPPIKNRLATPPRPGTAIGMTPQRPVRTDAQPVQPGVSAPMTVDRGVDTYTYFTQAGIPQQGTPILYNGDRQWAKVSLILETAGPVVIGTRAEITPVLSGKGSLLPTNVVVERIIPKGSKLYIAATAVNRVSVTIEPLPWLEQIAQTNSALVEAVKK